MHNQQDPMPQYPLEALIEKAVICLKQEYSKRYRQLIQSTWRTFLDYAQAADDGGTFSTGLAKRFLASQYGFPSEPEEEPTPVSDDIRPRLRAMHMLVDFAIHGRLVHCSRTTFVLLTTESQRVLDAFTADWYRGGLSARALRPCLVRLRQFFLYLQANDLTYTMVNPTVISAFVTEQLEFRQRTVEMITYYLRKFFRFLYLNGYLPTDWSSDVPKLRVVACKRIPSTWRREDVDRLLAAVDRGNPVGKRDYAILLLVARLGLRVGDIRELQLEHFQWEKRQLVFPQSKTGQVVSLPLLDEIGWAVIDYLQHGRPQTQARQVFVQHRSPFAPFAPNNNLYNMITQCRQRAGIPLPPEQKRGLHSLRHTLASALLEQQTPLSTIAAILGHLDSGSTKVYLKVGLTQLRQCALDLEEVSNATA
jgi:integrase/recombinase XerD